MTNDFFKAQITRLQVRFPKALDNEFVMLAWKETHDMSESGFQRFCDVLIGSRTHHKPPLLSEFREARLNEHKRQFDNDVRAAASVMFGGATPGSRKAHVLRLLSKEYGKVSSVTEAVEVARMKLRVARANERGPA